MADLSVGPFGTMYVPVLKGKKGEFQALSLLGSNEAHSVTQREFA
jgi:hypothetical protein